MGIWFTTMASLLFPMLDASVTRWNQHWNFSMMVPRRLLYSFWQVCSSRHLIRPQWNLVLLVLLTGIRHEACVLYRNKVGPTPNGLIKRLVLLTVVLLSGCYSTRKFRIYRISYQLGPVIWNPMYVSDNISVRESSRPKTCSNSFRHSWNTNT